MLRFLYFFAFMPFLLLSCAAPEASTEEPSGPNTEESKVPAYELPPLLQTPAGTSIETEEDWAASRKRILQLFRDEVYGHVPGTADSVSLETSEEDATALGGTAIRKQWKLTVWKQGNQHSMDVLLYLPNSSSDPVPLFLGMNFYGNHTVHEDPAIWMTGSWVRNNEEFGIEENKATEASRGVHASRWAIEQIIQRGYGVATIYYGDVVPDVADCFGQGIFPLFYREGQQPTATEWGAIAAWAWSLSRILDVLEDDPAIDSDRVAVLGHSRLGKTALWAGAEDSRFAMVISNNSGCGGAALSRREFGETVKAINDRFPHWFNDRFPAYNDRVGDLPLDQHMLISLMAPRPVYVASASEDLWADPKGEFLSASLASPVYALFGKEGLSQSDMPSPDQPINSGHIGYHLRTGKHDLTAYDWQQYMDFADQWMR
ncbi:MAG: acetylxylan esterase [Bacteroidota bacterium]